MTPFMNQRKSQKRRLHSKAIKQLISGQGAIRLKRRWTLRFRKLIYPTRKRGWNSKVFLEIENRGFHEN